MALTIQQLSDRAEIEDLVTAYSAAIDSQEFDQLTEVFVADAHFDYRKIAEFECRGVQEFITWVALGLGPMAGRYFHLCVPTRIEIDGDHATALTLCINPIPSGDGTRLIGLWYRDRFIRTEAGWRIAERVLDVCFNAELPG